METGNPYQDGPDCQAWIEELLKSCTCCAQCQIIPCCGLELGGLCDDICICDDPNYEEISYCDFCHEAPDDCNCPPNGDGY